MLDVSPEPTGMCPPQRHGAQGAQTVKMRDKGNGQMVLELQMQPGHVGCLLLVAVSQPVPESQTVAGADLSGLQLKEDSCTDPAEVLAWIRKVADHMLHARARNATTGTSVMDFVWPDFARVILAWVKQLAKGGRVFVRVGRRETDDLPVEKLTGSPTALSRLPSSGDTSGSSSDDDSEDSDDKDDGDVEETKAATSGSARLLHGAVAELRSEVKKGFEGLVQDEDCTEGVASRALEMLDGVFHAWQTRTESGTVSGGAGTEAREYVGSQKTRAGAVGTTAATPTGTYELVDVLDISLTNMPAEVILAYLFRKYLEPGTRIRALLKDGAAQAYHALKDEIPSWSSGEQAPQRFVRKLRRVLRDLPGPALYAVMAHSFARALLDPPPSDQAKGRRGRHLLVRCLGKVPEGQAKDALTYELTEAYDRVACKATKEFHLADDVASPSIVDLFLCRLESGEFDARFLRDAEERVRRTGEAKVHAVALTEGAEVRTSGTSSGVSGREAGPRGSRPPARGRRQSKPGGPGRAGKRRDRSQVQCFQCHQFGHYKNECTSAPTDARPPKDQPRALKCHCCGGLGHYARDCPTSPAPHPPGGGPRQDGPKRPGRRLKAWIKEVNASHLPGRRSEAPDRDNRPTRTSLVLSLRRGVAAARSDAGEQARIAMIVDSGAQLSVVSEQLAQWLLDREWVMLFDVEPVTASFADDRTTELRQRMRLTGAEVAYLESCAGTKAVDMTKWCPYVMPGATGYDWLIGCDTATDHDCPAESFTNMFYECVEGQSVGPSAVSGVAHVWRVAPEARLPAKGAEPETAVRSVFAEVDADVSTRPPGTESLGSVVGAGAAQRGVARVMDDVAAAEAAAVPSGLSERVESMTAVCPSGDVSGAEDDVLLMLSDARGHSQSVLFNPEAVFADWQRLGVLDVFRTDVRDDPPLKFEPYDIVLRDGFCPQVCAPCRFSAEDMQFIQQYTDMMVETGRMVRVTVPQEWCAPVLVVTKPGVPASAPLMKRKRMVVSLVRLNGECLPVAQVAVDPRAEVVRLGSVLDEVRSGGVFVASSLDCLQGYYQYPLSEESQRLAVVHCGSAGLFAMTRLPMGLAASPSVFQAAMLEVFRNAPEKLGVVLVYVDDVVVVSSSVEKHQQLLNWVLQRSHEFNLKLSVKKAALFRREVTWCGLRISGNGVVLDPRRRGDLLRMKVPVNAAELQSYLGSANWLSDAVPGYAEIHAGLLRILNECLAKTKKRTKAQAAKLAFVDLGLQDTVAEQFEASRKALGDAVPLHVVSGRFPVCVFTDASDVAVGGLVAQAMDMDLERPVDTWRLVPLAYFSKTLSAAQRKWSVHQRELFAAVCVVTKHWQLLAAGTEKHLFVDANNLYALFQRIDTAVYNKPTSDRLTRWVLAVAHSGVRVHHLSGSLNLFADTLSRQHGVDETVTGAVRAVRRSNRQKRPTSKELDRMRGDVRDFLDDTGPSAGGAPATSAGAGAQAAAVDGGVVDPVDDGPVADDVVHAADVDGEADDDVGDIAVDGRAVSGRSHVHRSEGSRSDPHQPQSQFHPPYALEYDPADVPQLGEVVQLQEDFVRRAESAPTAASLEADWLRELQHVKTVCAWRDLGDTPAEARGVRGLVTETGRLYVPPDLDGQRMRLRFCVAVHAGVAGHRAFDATVERLIDVVFWPTLRADVREFVRRCMVCVSLRGGRKVPRPLGHVMAPTRARQVLDVDWFYVTPARDGNKYILTMVDRFSGYVMLHVSPVATAVAAVDGIMRWIELFGPSTILCCDGGSHNRGVVQRELVRRFRMKVHVTTAYAPWTVPAERTNQELKKALLALTQDYGLDVDEWPLVVQLAVMTLNSVRRASRAGYTPDEVHLGKERGPLFPCVWHPSDEKFRTQPFITDDQVRGRVVALRDAIDGRREEVLQALERVRKRGGRTRLVRNASPLQLECGDYVMVAQIPGRLRSKISLRWVGPWKISAIVRHNVYKIVNPLSGEERQVHGSHLRFYCDSALKLTQALKDVMARNDGGYVVFDIEDHRVEEEEVQLKVTWVPKAVNERYTVAEPVPEEEKLRTWEPMALLLEDARASVLEYIRGVPVADPLKQVLLDLAEA